MTNCVHNSWDRGHFVHAYNATVSACEGLTVIKLYVWAAGGVSHGKHHKGWIIRSAVLVAVLQIGRLATCQIQSSIMPGRSTLEWFNGKRKHTGVAAMWCSPSLYLSMPRRVMVSITSSDIIEVAFEISTIASSRPFNTVHENGSIS